MSNKETLMGLESAIKSIKVSDLGDGVLQPGHLKKYEAVVQGESQVLGKVKKIEMDSETFNLDTFTFGRRVMKKINPDGSTEEVKPAFSQNQLHAKEIGFDFPLTLQAIRRAINKGGLEDQVVLEAGRTASLDVEDLGFNGDTTGTGFLSTTDGWLKKAAHQNAEDVDYTDPATIIDAFDNAIKVIPSKYFNHSDFTFFVPFDVYEAYREYWINRQTGKGDYAASNAGVPEYKGVEVERITALDVDETETKVLLSSYKNMVWGEFVKVYIDSGKNVPMRRIDFALTTAVDFHFINEAAAATITFTDVTPTT